MMVTTQGNEFRVIGDLTQPTTAPGLSSHLAIATSTGRCAAFNLTDIEVLVRAACGSPNEVFREAVIEAINSWLPAEHQLGIRAMG